MRALYAFAFLLPCPALADTIAAQSKITAVTVFSQGALITREVVFDATAGSHDLVITDLPSGTVPQLIRMTPAAGISVGAYGLRTDRLPPQGAKETPAQLAAEAEVERLEAVERAAQSAIDAINARIEAAEAQANFLRAVVAEGGTLTVDALRDISGMIGQEVLAAREDALAAQGDLPAALKVLADAQEALTAARDTQAALLTGAENYAALTVAVQTATAGKGSITVTHYVGEASWAPVYDMELTRKPTSDLKIKRGVLVSQYSGEDWSGVALTLSTAQPSAQAAPSALWAELRQIVPEAPPEAMLEQDGRARTAATLDYALAAEPMAAPTVTTAATMIEGDVVVYQYPTAVNVATGVENLRLALDEISVTPQIEARAVPRRDATAFLVANFTNTSDEILLPGEAFLVRDGTLVGSTMFGQTAPGVETELAFGAIDGLRLKREMPVRAEGDRGIITTSRQITESAVLQVENLTGEAWPIRLMDQVPYSEQEDLEITYSASVQPNEVDVDGNRGVLAWTFDLAPKEKAAITLDTLMVWPDGMVLQ